MIAGVALLLATAPTVFADPGTAQGTGTQTGNGASTSSAAPAQTASDSSTAAPETSPGNSTGLDPGGAAAGLTAAAADPTDQTSSATPPTTGQSTTAGATTDQSSPQNDNGAVRNGQQGNNGNVGQTNSANASATGNGQGNGNGNGTGNGQAATANGVGNGVGNGQQNDNGQGNGQGNGVANGQGNGTGNGQGNGNGNGNSSASSSQDTPTNSNVVVRVDSPGGTGTVDQSNAAQSGATTTDTGAPDTTNSSPDTGSAATVGAGSSQSSAANSNVDVRVGSGGDSGDTSQANTTQANASAGSPGGGTANATTSQTAPTNLNVTIRVGSGGDNGDASQSNSATATAGAGPAQGSGVASSQPAGIADTNQTTTTSGNADVDNSSTVDQEIEQAGDTDPSVPSDQTISSADSAAAGNVIGSATTAQTDPTNINVSIRIGSPGTDGSVTQKNDATATGTSADLGVVNVTGGGNVNVKLVIPGATSGAPSGTWTWNWVWNGDWTLPAGATAADVASTVDAIWNWVWQNQSPQAAASTTAGAPAAAAATTTTTTTPSADGTWTWTWTWKLPNGQTWTAGWVQSCSCNWTWSWNWDWSMGAPLSTSPDVAATTSAVTGSDIGPVTQQNVASSNAVATATSIASQSLDQIQSGGDPVAQNQVISADQSLLQGQAATAAAEADQTDAWNLSLIRGIASGPVFQSNEVTASALASVTVSIAQSTVQHQSGNTTADQSATSSQQLESAQTAVAGALAGQTDARNVLLVAGPSANGRISSVEQRNSASTTVSAVVTATLEQWIGQFQNAGSSLAQGADATQTLGNIQSATAAAVVSQTSTWNIADIEVPATSHATNPSLLQQNLVFSTSTTSNSATTSQWILQSQEGTADVELASAQQDGTTSQKALAFAPAQQTGLINRSGWLGVEPPAGPGSSIAAPPAPPEAVSTLIAGGFLLGTLRSGAPLTLPWQQTLPSLRTPPALRGVPHSSSNAAMSVGSESGGAPGSGVASELTPAAGGAGTSTPREGGARHGSAPGDEDAGSILLLSPGAASPAPHGGAGAFGLLERKYEFVAPAHLGPQSPAPTLGRSVAFLDPIERPG